MQRQQSIGNFNEIVGTRKSDRLKGGNLDLIYSLGNDDILTTKRGSSVEVLDTTVLVGGTGNDRYKLGTRATTVILDNGNSDRDLVVAKGIRLNSNTSFVGEVDNRHLYAGDLSSGQLVFVLNWKQEKNRIEKVQLADGSLTHQQLRDNLTSFPNYLGNSSWRQLSKDGTIDLNSIGLSPSTVDNAIESISKRATRLEKSGRRSADLLTGSTDTAWVGSEVTLEEQSQPTVLSPRSLGDSSLSFDAVGTPFSEPIPVLDGLGAAIAPPFVVSNDSGF